jgi:hypothetical protein
MISNKLSAKKVWHLAIVEIMTGSDNPVFIYGTG